MKKLVALLLTLALVLSTAAVLAEITVTPVAPKGRDYSYAFKTVTFKADYAVALMDSKYEKTLNHAVLPAEGDVLVALSDLQSVYAPDFKIVEEDGKLTVTHVGLTWTLDPAASTATDGSVTYQFTKAFVQDGEEVLVPAVELMETLFAKSTVSGSGYYTISLTLDDAGSVPSATKLDSYIKGEKLYGFRYLTYTIEDDPDQKVLPVRLYIPTTYDPSVPQKAILMLHGGSQSGDYFFSDTSRAVPYYRSVEMYAEENGFLLIAPTAYVKSGDYGEYSEDATEEKKATTILSEKSVIAGLDYIESVMNIDKDHLYIFGQSMGGFGTAFIGNKYADRFDAFVICACLRDVREYDENPYPNLVDRPIFFVYGTEDTACGGIVKVKELFTEMNKLLHNMQFHAAAGGVHSTAWNLALPEVFEFINSQY